MAAKKVRSKRTGKLIYASKRNPRRRGPALGTKRNPDMDWATWTPIRKFGVYANLGTSYTHNGIRKFS